MAPVKKSLCILSGRKFTSGKTPETCMIRIAKRSIASAAGVGIKKPYRYRQKSSKIIRRYRKVPLREVRRYKKLIRKLPFQCLIGELVKNLISALGV